MSDYINKSAFSEALNRSEKQPTGDSEDYIEGYCEGWNDVIDIRNRVPTVDEKEIIRKAFERIKAIFEERAEKHLGEAKMQKHNRFYNIANQYESRAYCYIEAMEIVDEECGINE